MLVPPPGVTVLPPPGVVALVPPPGVTVLPPQPVLAPAVASPVPSSRAPAFTYWVEYKNEEGKPYYHNSSTKQTVWDMPAEYKAFVEARIKPVAAPPAGPTLPAAPTRAT